MTKAEFKAELIEYGYKDDKYDCLYRYIPEMSNCIFNEKPPVVQIKLWDFADNVSINVRGQNKDGYWIIIDFYSVTFNEALNNLKDIEQKLTAAWNSIN
jgi:hypothetical protein